MGTFSQCWSPPLHAIEDEMRAARVADPARFVPGLSEGSDQDPIVLKDLIRIQFFFIVGRFYLDGWIRIRFSQRSYPNSALLVDPIRIDFMLEGSDVG